MKGILKGKLFGEGIYLRELTLKDASPEYCSWLNDPEVNKYLETWKSTIADLKKYITGCRESADTILLGIFDRTNDVHIGNVKLGPIVDWNKKRTVYGIMVGNKNYWGKGIGTAATKLAIEVAFNVLNLNEVELGVVGDNKKARKVFEKSGFRVVEIRKNGLQYRDKVYDKVVMEIKKSSRDFQQSEVVFVLSKKRKDCVGAGKKVLLAASEPLAFRALAPIIDRLRRDKRCSLIAIVTDNIAGRAFAEYFGADKSWKKEAKIISGYDAVLTTLDAYDSPGMHILKLGKKGLDAKKLFILHYSWTSVPKTKSMLAERGVNKKAIDGIFCNDDLAKEIISFHIPELKNKIFVTGTPVVEELDVARARQSRVWGRKKLGLKSSDVVALYLGDTHEDYKDDKTIDRYLNKKTLHEVVEAMACVAEFRPEQKFALLLRPHPRDLNKFEILSYVHPRSLPVNLKLIPATWDLLTINQVTYIADVVLSIISTENHLAPLRGRRAVFLGFDVGSRGEKLGGAILDKIYGKNTLSILNKNERLSVVRKREDLVDYLKNFIDKNKIIPKMGARNSVKRILNQILI